jgi:UDP-N-acetylglucosamine 2-epimerase
MQDLAARIAPLVRSPAALAAVAESISLDLVPGHYAFATVHRAENRDPSAMRRWVSLLGSVAEDLRVVLALHPGTLAALEAAGIGLPPSVDVIPPQGYRSSLTLQYHAAVVLTDSGGVQREAAWLDTPCLVLRDRTEWVEAVAESAGRMVLVGLDAERARSEVRRLVREDAERQAKGIAIRAEVAPAGAAEAISSQLGTAIGR